MRTVRRTMHLCSYIYNCARGRCVFGGQNARCGTAEGGAAGRATHICMHGRLGIWGTGCILPPFPLAGLLPPHTLHAPLPALVVHLTAPPYLPFPPPLVPSQNGLTPLHKAASNGHMEVIKALLAAGASKDIADKVSRWLLAAPTAVGGSRAERGGSDNAVAG